MTSAVNDEDRSHAVEIIDGAATEGSLSAHSVENLNRWLTEPQYSEFVPRILQLLNASRFDELETMFWQVIPFGTGGRRGLMGEFGSATMNTRTIAESAYGLATYLRQITGKAGGRAVVGCDTRHRSEEFARLTSATFAACGLQVSHFSSHRSTPEISFAVRHLRCDIGVMISASHNPPSDNGFKAYWSNGGQILSPHDGGIIECVYNAAEIPALSFDDAVQSGSIEIIGDEVDAAYVEAVSSLTLSSARDVSAIFSPLHGVGETSVFRVLRESGFDGVEIFEPQREPHGDFPNVPDHLPNPERTEVFAPIIAYARDRECDVILASDPDADRLGVAVRGADGEFVPLTGNRIGVLIADYVLRKRQAFGSLSPQSFVVETLVTTPLIGELARSHNVRAVDDLLVGFKYIGQTMDEQGADDFVFGAEESLGYLAGKYARDKDAAIAALYLLELAAELRSTGRTLLDRLDEIWREHGYYTESQQSKVCPGTSGKAMIERLMQSFRDSPPESLAGIPLARVRDYRDHEIRSLPDNVPILPLDKPQGDLLFFESVQALGQFSFAVRPSGTEPKIKFYFFATGDCNDPAALPGVRERTEDLMMTVGSNLGEWVENVLAEP